MKRKLMKVLNNKSLLFFIVLALQISNNNFAQDLVDKYKNFLPQKYLYNPDLREQLSVLLETKSHIHPDLIYYYLTYYNLLAGSQTVQEKAECNNFKMYISSIENKFLEKRNVWIERQLSALDTMEIEVLIKGRVIDKFKQLLTSITSGPIPSYTDFKIDENQVNFFSALYFNPDLYPKYLPDTNYLSLKGKEEEKVRQEILSVINETGKAQSQSEEDMISFILNRWFVLDDVTGVQASKIIATLTMNEHSIDRQPSISFGIGYAPYNQACSVKPSLFINGLGENFDFEVQSPMRQVGLTLGYKYYLKDVVGFLSYVNTQFIYYYSFPSGSEITQPGFNKTYSEGTFDYKEDLTFNKSIMTPQSGQSIYLNISIPVYFALGIINVEAGLLAGYNQVKYKYEYSYSYTKTESYMAGSMWNQQLVTYLLAKGSGKNSYETSEQKVVYSPELAVNFFPSRYLTANICLTTQFISLFLLCGF